MVVYLLDTLRADRLGVYGYDKPTTPSLDALAARSVVFEQAYSSSPWTLPSLVSLMVSRPICEHGVVEDGDRLHDDLEPLAERLADMGYATASFYANPYAGARSGMQRGFALGQSLPKIESEPIEAWLAQQGEKPFFLYVHDVQPHNPFEAQNEFLEPFGKLPPQVRGEIKSRMLGYRSLTRADHEAQRPVGSTDNTLEQRRAMEKLNRMREEISIAYDASVREADERVGRLVRFLEKRGELDDTIFVVVADHGEEMNEHGGWMHDQSVYEELVRAPLLVHLPKGAQGGTRVSSVVTNLDVMPTILDAIGRAEAAADARGRSLLPLARGESPKAEPIVTAMRINRKKFYRPWKQSRGDVNVVVRDGAWKAIWNVEPDRVELYDLSTDPGEQKDLAAEHPERVASLRSTAESWYRECVAQQKEPARAPEPHDPATVERLRQLGYVD